MASGDFLAKIKLALEGKDAVVSGLQQTQQAAQKLSSTKVTTTFDKEGLASGKQIEETFKTIKPAADKANVGMKDFINSMRRALIVAPIWMALRGAMQFFITGIKEGMEYLLAFDKQMLLVSQAVQALGANSADINLLKDSFMSLSRETGNSAAKIAKVYLEIAKASGSYVEASETVKTAVLAQEVAQSDSLDITKSLALAIKLQGDSFSKTATQQEKYKEVASTLYALSSKNLVTFEDLAKEYNSFVPAGQAANLTFQETAAILATLNSAGISNVQGLKTALLRTLADSENIGKELGIAISPDTKPIELFMTVLSKFKAALKGGTDLKAFAALGELFGKGGRGGSIIIKALSDSMEQLNKNLSITKFPTENADAFNKSLKELQSSLPHQVEEMENLKIQMFEAFVIGVTGGKDFADGLNNINKILTDSILTAEAFGVVLRGIASAASFIPTIAIFTAINDENRKQIALSKEQIDLYDRIQKAIKGEYNLKTSIQILEETKTSKLITDEKLRRLSVDALENQVKSIHKATTAEENKTKASSNTLLVLKEQQKELDKQKIKLEALVFQYEKASPLEKGDIRRQMELQTKTPEEVVRAYEESPYDKNLILKNISNFTDEIRTALANSIGRERGLDAYTTNPYLAQVSSPTLNQTVTLGDIIISINPDSLNNLAELSGDMLTLALLKNPDVQQLIANIALNANPKR